MRRRPLTPTLRSALDAVSPGPVRQRLRQAVPVIGQCAITAGVAWWTAAIVFGHGAPVFAATASVICLAATVGGRAHQAVDLIAGVLAGVAVGQVIRALHIGTGFWQIALAVALAMAVAALVDARPLAYIQSGATVLVVLTLAPTGSPFAHVLDAMVGGALGLFGSQVLFSPDPVKLVAAPVREVLQDAAAGVRAAAEALRRGSPELAGTACDHARDAHARLGEVARARQTAGRVSGRTVRGRRQASRLGQVDHRLDDVDILVATALLLSDDVRDRLTANPAPIQGALPDRLTALADALAGLAARRLPPVADVMSDAQPPANPPAPPEPSGLEVHLHGAVAALHRLHATTVPD
jgi:hypothetical protein